MIPSQIIKTIFVIGAIGFMLTTTGESEARNLPDQDGHNSGSIVGGPEGQPGTDHLIHYPARVGGDQIDSDDDDDDDDRLNLQDPSISAGQTNNAMPMEQVNHYYRAAPGAPDLKTSASYHHHGHGVKGWLDMGAWTGKKGSFGWHDKHPVGGKGK